MAKVFISYSRKDLEFAKRLTTELTKSDLDYWIDWEGIPPSVDWLNEIEKGIEEADIFLFLISPDSAKSKICGDEIDIAVKNSKRMIPIVVREIEWQDTPPKLGHLNYIFFSREDNFDTAVRKLLTAIRTDYEWVATHRRLQVKALEWERSVKEKSFLLRGTDLKVAEEQLAHNSSKDPNPTDLQREYVFASREAADQQRRTTTIISVVVGIALLALSIYSVIQARSAINSQATAEANLVVAQTAQANSDANAATAVANEQEAIRQANIALARQLAAQAQSVFTSGPANQELAVLLGIQSARIYPEIDSAYILQNNILARPVALLAHEDRVGSFAFSPSGSYVVSGSSDATARVWEVATGDEISKITHQTPVLFVDFNSDGIHVLSGSEDGIIRVWEAATGKEITSLTHSDATSAVFSPYGAYVLSLDTITIRVWDATNGNELAHMTHDGSVTSFAVSSDENYVVSGSEDGTVRVWELLTGNEIARLSHDGPVRSFAVGSDENYVVSGSEDGTVRVWELLTGNEIVRIPAGGSESSVSFSPNGNYVSGSDGLYAYVWDATNGNEIAKTYYDDYTVTYNTFSPNGGYVLSLSSDGIARVWEATTGTGTAYIFNNGRVNSVEFSPDGSFVIAGGCVGSTVFSCQNGFVRIVESATGRDVAYMPHQSEVIDVAFSPNGKHVISLSADGTARIWNANANKETARFVFGDSFTSLAFSPDGQYVVTGSGDSPAHVFDVLTGLEIARSNHDWPVDSLTFSPDSKIVASGDYDGATVWDPLTGNEISRVNHKAPLSTMAFSTDGKFIATGGCGELVDNTCSNGAVRVFESSTGQEVAHMPHEFEVNDVSFTVDEKYVISRSTDNSTTIILVWEIATGKSVNQMSFDGSVMTFALSPDGQYVVSAPNGHTSTARITETSTGREVAHMIFDGQVLFLDFSSDGRYIVIGAEDGSARVWEAATGEEIAHLSHDNPVSAIAISPDASYVVSTACEIYEFGSALICQRSTILVWDVSTEREIARANFDDIVFDVGISPDGKYVAVGGGGPTNFYAPGSVVVIEAATGREVIRIPHDLLASSVAFSPDGRFLVSHSYDKTTFLPSTHNWLWQTKDLISNACLRVTRNLTRAEWEQYMGEALPYPVKQEEAACPNLPIEPGVSATPTTIP